jgi:toxin FitB
LYLLDTNVVSELLRPMPDPRAIGWFSAHPTSSLYLSTVSEAELLLGVTLLPEGKRRSALAAAVEAILAEEFSGRILSFDRTAAQCYAAISASCRMAGRPISAFDGQIASIALANDLSVVTRNLRDFAGCGIGIIDPWQAA